jgi:hypothetical protein
MDGQPVSKEMEELREELVQFIEKVRKEIEIEKAHRKKDNEALNS